MGYRDRTSWHFGPCVASRDRKSSTGSTRKKTVPPGTVGRRSSVARIGFSAARLRESRGTGRGMSALGSTPTDLRFISAFIPRRNACRIVRSSAEDELWKTTSRLDQKAWVRAICDEAKTFRGKTGKKPVATTQGTREKANDPRENQHLETRR